MQPQLTEKEALFCAYYAQSGDARAAAAAAGYRNPRRSGAKLLRRPQITAALAEPAAEALPAAIERGLRALAFGSAADAVRLLLRGEELTADEVEKLDLFIVSDLKRPKGGGMEIKFFDRLKALEALSRCAGAQAQEGGSFLQALSAGARLLSEEEEDV
ncbi:MAG: terminase small subunit [Clostridia bacterium]|nr:terminase small subunit [Clostridia bacterium]